MLFITGVIILPTVHIIMVGMVADKKSFKPEGSLPHNFSANFASNFPNIQFNKSL